LVVLRIVADVRPHADLGLYDVLWIAGDRLLTGYESIGTWAPALLLLARLFQGLSVGGEYGTSATYMSEIASKVVKVFTPHSSTSRSLVVNCWPFLWW
jgi:MFS family permease